MHGRFSYPETRCREPGAQDVAGPAHGLERERRPGVVPGDEPCGLVDTEIVAPASQEPLRMGGSCSPLPARRFRELPERLVHVPRAAFTRDLPRQLHARRNRRIGRHARQRPQLVGAEPQHVVEAGIDGLERERPIELGPASQDTGRELVREPSVPLDEMRERPVASRLKGGSHAHRVEDLQCRAASGSRVLNPAFLRAAKRARRPRVWACDRRGRPRARRRPRAASRAPWRRGRAPRPARYS